MRKPAYCLNCDDGTLLKYGACDVTETIDGHSTLVHALCGRIARPVARSSSATTAVRPSVTTRR